MSSEEEADLNGNPYRAQPMYQFLDSYSASQLSKHKYVN